MKKQVVVVGLGRFGESVARSLTRIGHDVLAVDVSERKVQNVASVITHAIQADATNEAVLSELGVRNFDVAVVAIGSDIQSSVLSTILLKKVGISYVVARASNALHADILRRIGADKVVFPEEEMGDRIAHEVRLPGVSDYLPITAGYGITKVVADPGLVGKALGGLQTGRWSKEGVIVLLIRRGRDIIVAPGLSETIKPGDELVIAGNDDKLETFLAR